MEPSRSLSKMLDRASQRALVTGEWYIPGHRLRGFRIDDEASIGFELGLGFWKGEEKVEMTGIGDVGSIGEEEEKGLMDLERRGRRDEEMEQLLRENLLVIIWLVG